MFKLLNFLLCCVVLAFVVWSCYWYVTEPQPGKLDDQVMYLKDGTLYKLQTLADPISSDLNTAIAQLKPIAAQGNGVAQVKLAEIMFKTNNYLSAIQYLKPNVDHGNPVAQNAYGVMVRDGLGGVPSDKLEAYKWFSIAAGRGFKLAQDNALALSHQMTSNELVQAEQLADSWELHYQTNK